MSEARQIAHDLNDMVSDWLRKSGHVTAVPHAVVLETRNGPIHIEMRAVDGNAVTIEIPREKAAEARAGLQMGRQMGAVIDAAKRGVEELRLKADLAALHEQPAAHVEAKPTPPAPLVPTPEQKHVLAETSRIEAARSRRTAPRAESKPT